MAVLVEAVVELGVVAVLVLVVSHAGEDGGGLESKAGGCQWAVGGVRGGDKHEEEGDEEIGTLVVAKLVELAALAFAAIAEAEGGEALLGLVGSGAKGYWER